MKRVFTDAGILVLAVFLMLTAALAVAAFSFTSPAHAYAQTPVDPSTQPVPVSEANMFKKRNLDYFNCVVEKVGSLPNYDKLQHQDYYDINLSYVTGLRAIEDTNYQQFSYERSLLDALYISAGAKIGC